MQKVRPVRLLGLTLKVRIVDSFLEITLQERLLLMGRLQMALVTLAVG